jgi:hypothetical protein
MISLVLARGSEATAQKMPPPVGVYTARKKQNINVFSSEMLFKQNGGAALPQLLFIS